MLFDQKKKDACYSLEFEITGLNSAHVAQLYAGLESVQWADYPSLIMHKQLHAVLKFYKKRIRVVQKLT